MKTDWAVIHVVVSLDSAVRIVPTTWMNVPLPPAETGQLATTTSTLTHVRVLVDFLEKIVTSTTTIVPQGRLPMKYYM